MHPDPNLVLIGFTGAGKTTVGAALAARLGRPHVDVDVALEAEVGPLPAFVEAVGVTAFRETEERVLRRILPAEGAVISCGAGTVRRVRSRPLVCRGARVFFLDVPAEVIAARLQAMPAAALHRPDLVAADPAVTRANVEQELHGRRSLYLALGERIDAAASVETVVEAIVTRLGHPRT
jgi:shikimate kinase